MIARPRGPGRAQLNVYQQHFFGVVSQGSCESDPYRDQDKEITEGKQRFILEFQLRSFLFSFHGHWGRNLCIAGEDTGPSSYIRNILKKRFQCFYPDIPNIVANSGLRTFLWKPGNNGK